MSQIFLYASVANSDFHPQLFFNILLANLRALFRRLGFVGHTIQLYHRPAAKLDILEGVENGGKIYTSATEFDKAINMTALVIRR